MVLLPIGEEDKMIKFIIVLSFIIIDFISGIISALKNKEFTSGVMRKGLYNKSGELILLGVGYLVSYTMKYYDIGYSNTFYITVSIYIIAMEISSIVENVGKINPKLVPYVIRKCFKQLQEKG